MALRHGVSPIDFWELSLGEVVDVIDANTKKERQQLKMDIMTKKVQAEQIIELLALSMNKDSEMKPTPIWEYYPGMFEKEKKLHIKQQQANELEALKERRQRFATVHNQRFGGDSS